MVSEVMIKWRTFRLFFFFQLATFFLPLDHGFLFSLNYINRLTLVIEYQLDVRNSVSKNNARGMDET